MIRLVSLATAIVVVAAACSSGESAPTSSGPTVQTTAISPVTTTTTTVAPTTNSATNGTLDDPVDGGEFGAVGDWNIRVVAVAPDAYQDILAYSEYTDQPEPGSQFFMISLEAQYAGTDSGEFWSDLTWKTVGPSSVAYEEASYQCGFIPDDIADSGEAFPGGVVTGNLCWSVTAEDADGLVLLLEPFGFETGDRVAYALDPQMAAVTPTEAATADLSRVPANAFGDIAQVGDWKVRVVDVNPDATDVVFDENEFADPPADGDQFVMVTIEAEFVGPDSGEFWSDMTWKTVGPSSVAYEDTTDGCGSLPDAIDDMGEVFPGGTITGNVCWSVSQSDIPDLLMILEEFAMDESGRTFFRLTSSD